MSGAIGRGIRRDCGAQLCPLPALVLGFAIAGLGCSDQGPAAAEPAAIEVQSVGLRGLPLHAIPAPLVVRVLDASDRLIRGATVSFSSSHGGTFNPATATTDAEGRAASIWTLGTGEGIQQATIRAGNVTITTEAVSRDPCRPFQTHTVEFQVYGTFTDTSCAMAGYYTDRHRFTVDRPRGVRLVHTSASFAAHLELWSSAGHLIGFGSAGGVGEPATMLTDLGAGTYEIRASTVGKGIRGAYALSTSLVDPHAGCEPVWINPGYAPMRRITESCSVIIDGLDLYGHARLFHTRSGTSLTLVATAYEMPLITGLYAWVPATGNFVLARALTTGAYSFERIEFIPGPGLWLLLTGAQAATDHGVYVIEYALPASMPAETAASWRGTQLVLPR
jgi:hypothetical protein